MTPNKPETPQGATQGDPAVEAAKRAVGDHHWWMTRLDDRTIGRLSDYGIAAAREALRPIREWLLKHKDDLSLPRLEVAIEDLLPLVYSDEELS